MVLDAFVEATGLTFQDERYAALARTKIKNRELYLIKPTTLVNLSGKAVRYWINSLNIPLSQLLVITDDVALPLGKLKLKKKGGDAGHNGMKHIIDLLGNKHFPRLRFGIGSNYPKGQQVQYVLGEWREEERQVINSKLNLSVQLIKDWSLQGIDNAMNQYNE